jgi:hypothetical protein
MRTLACLTALGLLPAFASAAFADEVVMKTGRRIEGVVTKETDFAVVLEIGGGTVVIERHLIAEIRYDPASAVRRGRELVDAVKDSRTPLDLWKAADWLERNGVSKEVRPLIDRALELDLDDNRMSPERYLLKLAREGIGEKTLRAYVTLYDIRTDIPADERKRLYDEGLKLELIEWLVGREEARRPPPPPPPAAPEPAPVVEEPQPAPPLQRPFRFHEQGYFLPPPMVVTPQLYPTYVPNYYGQYIYYYPYLNVVPYFVVPSK